MAPRILADLREAGEVVSVKTVAKLMRAAGVAGISPATWHPFTTASDGAVHRSRPRRSRSDFDRGVPDDVWTSDITYLRTVEGWPHLCAVGDGCSRRALGRRSPRPCTPTSSSRPCAGRRPSAGATREASFSTPTAEPSQNTSEQLACAANEVGARVSTGRTGVVLGQRPDRVVLVDAQARVLQPALICDQARSPPACRRWVEVSNRRRRHSSLGMTSPSPSRSSTLWQHKPPHRCPPSGGQPEHLQRVAWFVRGGGRVWR